MIAEDYCEELDAAVFSGDAFIEQRDLVVLQGYLTRWQDECRARLEKINKTHHSVETQDEDLA